MTAPYGGTVITGGGPAETTASRRPVLLAGLGAACISASAVLVKLADTGPATATFFRCALALPVLIVLAAVEQRRHGPRPLGAAVGSGIATVLGNLQVLFVAFVAWVVFRERPERRFLIALPVVMAGVVAVSGLVGAVSPGVHPLAGVGYGIGTSIAYAGFLLT